MTKNKDTKRELFIFSTVDYFSLKEHFEDMARKGWLIDKIKYSFAVYKKIEPSDLTFSVDIYPKISIFEAADKDDMQSYINLCEDAGWIYATSSKNLHIFYSKKEDNPIPVQTDEEIERMVIEKSILPEISVMILDVFIILLNIKIQLPYDYENLFTNGRLIMPFLWPLLLINIIGSTVGNIAWIIKAKKNIKDNLPLPVTNYKRSKMIGTFSFVFSIILIIILIISMILDATINSNRIVLLITPFLVPIIIYIYIKEIESLKTSKIIKILVLISIIFTLFVFTIFTALKMSSSDNENLELGYIGLTSEDFGSKVKPRFKHFDKEGSILVPRYSRYGEVSSVMSLETVNIETRGSKIARYIFDEMLVDELKYNRVLKDADNEYLGYDEAYYIENPNADIKNNSLFLLEGNKILFIDTDFDLSESKYVNIIMDKIKK